jgi:hypothetical protein
MSSVLAARGQIYQVPFHHRTLCCRRFWDMFVAAAAGGKTLFPMINGD